MGNRSEGRASAAGKEYGVWAAEIMAEAEKVTEPRAREAFLELAEELKRLAGLADKRRQ